MVDIKPFTIKPNMKKVFAFTTIKVVSVAVPILIIVAYLIYLIKIDTLKLVIQALTQSEDETLNAGKTTLTFIGSILVVVGLFMLLTFLSYRKRYISFNLDSVEADKEKIPYDNVSKVNYDMAKLENMIFKTGTLSIDLTGTQKKEISLDFVDNVEYIVKLIEQMRYQYKAQKYTQYAAQKKVEGILEKF